MANSLKVSFPKGTYIGAITKVKKKQSIVAPEYFHGVLTQNGKILNVFDIMTKIDKTYISGLKLPLLGAPKDICVYFFVGGVDLNINLDNYIFPLRNGKKAKINGYLNCSIDISDIKKVYEIINSRYCKSKTPNGAGVVMTMLDLRDMIISLLTDYIRDQEANNKPWQCVANPDGRGITFTSINNVTQMTIMLEKVLALKGFNFTFKDRRIRLIDYAD